MPSVVLTHEDYGWSVMPNVKYAFCVEGLVLMAANTGTVNVGVTLSSFDAFSEMFVTANPVASA